MAKTLGAVLASLIALGSVGATERPRAVLELFTSQGCSSCPPADRYLGDLADRPDLIALTLAVDYWDYLGWRDTLADPANTKRQKAYSHMRGDRQVYTPQMVVNGLAHAIGSDRAAVERALVQSSTQAGVLSVPVAVQTMGDTVTVILPAQSGAGAPVGPERPAVVLLMGVAARQPVEIARGENRGQTVTYRNVVRSQVVLGEWTGEARTFILSRTERIAPGCERAVVLVQSGTQRRPGAMLGAAMARLP